MTGIGHQRHAGIETYARLRTNHGVVEESHIVRRIGHFKWFRCIHDGAAKADVAREFAHAPSVHAKIAEHRLEPLPVTVDHIDQGKWHVTDLRKQLGNFVVDFFGRRIKQPIRCQCGETLFLQSCDCAFAIVVLLDGRWKLQRGERMVRHDLAQCQGDRIVGLRRESFGNATAYMGIIFPVQILAGHRFPA